ncbi:hypothetical protein GE09DRAFT_1095565 [Coniochaeta sp. 2T2.1]|nr:hypothetical protein GE09DRAFT_1095565 [Coniochaeta sp. 2T2.1]
MVDAHYFFSSCKSGWMWERLRSLALTSPVLRDPKMEPKRTAEIDGLLYKAGLTALRMPELQTMVLWNGGWDNACAFIYQTNGRGPRITWLSNWPSVISSPVEKVWRQVALQNSPVFMRIDYKPVYEPVWNHGDAIYHLKLPVQVVDPRSLWQIRREFNAFHESLPVLSDGS